MVKRSVVVAGHKTSVSLEEAFWNGMKEILSLCDMTLSELVAEIDSNREQGNLSSAIRLFVLDYFRSSRASRLGASRSRSRGSAKPQACSPVGATTVDTDRAAHLVSRVRARAAGQRSCEPAVSKRGRCPAACAERGGERAILRSQSVPQISRDPASNDTAACSRLPCSICQRP